MPRRAYILVSEQDNVICRVSTHNGKPNLSTYAEVAHVQNDLRHQYGRENQYTIYAIVPVTARVMLEPLDPLQPSHPTDGGSLSTVDMERTTQIMRATPTATAGRIRATSAPRPEPAPEDVERQQQEDRPEPEDLPF